MKHLQSSWIQFFRIRVDVSSDISVLHTMLAQEGLTGNDFSKKQL